jgi:hypothetical protein
MLLLEKEGGRTAFSFSLFFLLAKEAHIVFYFYEKRLDLLIKF